MAEYKGLSVVFEGDATSLSAALSTINARAQQAQGNLTALDRALKFDPTNAELLTRKTANLETSLSSARERAANLSSATSDLARKQREAAEAVQRTSKGYNEAKDRLREVDAQLKSNRSSMEALEEVLTDPRGNSQFLAGERQKYDALVQSTSALEEQRAVLGDVVSEHDRAKVAYEQASAALERNLTDTAVAEANVKRLARELDNNNGRLFASESAIGRFGTALESGGNKVSDLGDRIVRTSGELAAFSAMALAFGTGAVITQTEEFGNAIAQTGGYLDITGSKLAALQDLALEVGYSTQFSATEAAQAMSELAKGGMTEVEIAAGGLDATMALAAAGQMDLASAAETTVTSMRAFGLQAEDAMEIADALAGAANGSTAEVGDLAHAFSQCSAVAYNAGWSIQDTAGAIALLSDRGLQGEMAGTALKVMMQRLQSPTQAAAAVMEKYGVEVRDSNGQMKSATEITEELRTKIGSLGDAERDAALQTMFGTRASNAALILMQAGGDELQRYITLASDSGAASEMAQHQMGELGWAMEYLRGEAETAVVSLGNALTPTVIDLANAAQDLLSRFNSLSPAAQSLIGKAALAAVALPLLVTGVGALMSVGGRAASAIGTAAKAVSVFSGYAKSGASGATALGKALQFVGTNAKGDLTALGQVGSKLASIGGSAATAASNTGLVARALSLVKSAGAVGMFAAMAGIVLEFAAGVGRAALKTMEMAEAHERVEDAGRRLSEANEELAETYRRTTDSTYSFTDAEEDAASTSHDAASGLDTLAASVEQLNESMKNNQISYETEITRLNEAQAAIDKYANTSGLSAAEQERLKQAIDYVNQACGTQYEVVDAANGKIRDQGNDAEVTAEQIDELIQKQRELARQEAIQQNLTDAYKAYYAALETATEKQEEYAEAVEKTKQKEQELAEWKAQHQTGDKHSHNNGFDTWENWQKYQDLDDELEDLESKETDAKKALDEANGSLEEQGRLIDNLESELDDTNLAMSGSLKTLQDWVDHTTQLNTSRWTDELRKGFVDDFQAMGLSLEDFQNLSVSTLSDISTNYDGSLTGLVAILARHADEFGDEGVRSALEFYNGISEGSKSTLADIGMLTLPVLQALDSAAEQAGISGDKAIEYFMEGMASGAINAGSSAEEIAAYIAQAAQNDAEATKSGESLGAKLTQSAYGSARKEADANGRSTGAYIIQAVLGGMSPNGQFAGRADEAAQEYSYELGGNAVLTEGGVRLVDNASAGAAPDGKFGAQGSAGLLEYLLALASGAAAAGPYGTAMRDAAAMASQPSGMFSQAGAAAGTEYGSGLRSQEGSATSAGGTLASAADAALRAISLFNFAGYVAGLSFSSGLSGTSWLASNAGRSLANAAKGAMDTSWAWSSGNRLGLNFASGIRSAYGSVSSAARSLANAAAAYLHHSTPDKGPLRDDDVWGLHLAENIADGMRRGARYVSEASAALAASVVEPVASWGPVSPGSYQYQSPAGIVREIAAAIGDAVSSGSGGDSGRSGVYIENQNFNTRVVRSGDDLYAAAPIIYRNAQREARSMSR